MAGEDHREVGDGVKDLLTRKVLSVRQGMLLASDSDRWGAGCLWVWVAELEGFNLRYFCLH